MEGRGPAAPGASVVLLWIPVGAGGHLVRHTSRWWELAQASLERRAPQRLFHAALEITVGGDGYVIEMAPAWGPSATGERGVVATGPVGLRFLGRSRFFRYEVRCWRGGAIPDRDWAVGGPVTITRDEKTARSLLERIERVPVLIWGRKPPGTGDMWNSNSLIAWLAAATDHDVGDLTPPPGGRAPGWDAGLAVAARSDG